MCANGSKKAAPTLHAVASTWLSCVELPIQRLFLGISAVLNLILYDAPVLHCFVDAVYANDLRKSRSTTGVVFTFCGGAIVYKLKTQTITASSSTEAEFIAAHTAGKITRYL